MRAGVVRARDWLGTACAIAVPVVRVHGVIVAVVVLVSAVCEVRDFELWGCLLVGLLRYHVRRVLGARRECTVAVVVGVGADGGQTDRKDHAAIHREKCLKNQATCSLQPRGFVRRTSRPHDGYS